MPPPTRHALIAWPDPALMPQLGQDLSRLGLEVRELTGSESQAMMRSGWNASTLLVVCSGTAGGAVPMDNLMERLLDPLGPLIMVAAPDQLEALPGASGRPYHFIPPSYTLRELSVCVGAVLALAQLASGASDRPPPTPVGPGTETPPLDPSRSARESQLVRSAEVSYRGLFECSSDAILVLDPAGVILDANCSCTKMYGWPREDLLGNTIGFVCAPDGSSAQQAAVRLEQVLRGQPVQLELMGRRRDGPVFPMELSLHPGTLFGLDVVYAMARDISQRRKNLEQIRVLAHAVASVNDSIAIVNLQQVITYVNPAFCRLYGYSEEELVGQHISIIRSAHTPPDLSDEIFRESLDSGWRGELVDRRKDGVEIPVHLSSSAIRNASGQVILFFGIINDITERKQRERELVVAKERAEESDRLKTAFLSNMSHEIRSPMHSILGFLQLLADEEQLSDTGRQYLDQINASGNQLLCIIDDIIDISKIQANQLRLKYQHFDVNELLTDLHTLYSSQVAASGRVGLTLKRPALAASSPFVVHSDRLRIRQVLMNLIGNALKFTPLGSIEFGYYFPREESESKVCFFVKDTGIGLSEAHQGVVFDRFRQVDESYSRAFGGAGLGLAICKGLVNLLGGDIWVESRMGEGSTFHFYLYLAPILSPQHQPPSQVRCANEAPPTADWAGQNLLVVEDLPEIRYLLERLLAPTGAKLHFAANGQEARELFQRLASIDLVLLDIRLPDTDGYALAREFKAKRAEVPIIAQTAYAMHEERDRCLQAGCDDYITKPLNPQLLIRKASGLMGATHRGKG